MSGLPDPATFLSGERGAVEGRRARLRARAGDLWLDMLHALRGSAHRLEGGPPREVLVMSIYRPESERLSDTLPQLESEHHTVRYALGSTAADTLPHTVATGLAGGKFENLNAVRAAAGEIDPDWTLVVDDDVALPRRFLDRFLAVCEHFGFDLAQPAQTLMSHAAWPVTRRRAGVARETGFVEIGPVTAFNRRTGAELIPFPNLRYGWGLDAHWAALARERGWKLGVVDAVPVRHEHAAVASAYSSPAAIEEAQRFLAGRPYVENAGRR